LALLVALPIELVGFYLIIGTDYRWPGALLLLAGAVFVRVLLNIAAKREALDRAGTLDSASGPPE
jgi:hypothetical protein